MSGLFPPVPYPDYFSILYILLSSKVSFLLYILSSKIRIMSFFIKNNVRFRSESTRNRSDSEQTISTQNLLGIQSEPLGTDRILSGNWVSAWNPIGSNRKTWGTEKYCFFGYLGEGHVNLTGLVTASLVLLYQLSMGFMAE